MLSAPLALLKSCLDEIRYGERTYSQRCEEEGGLKVFDRISGVRGMFVQGVPGDCPYCEHLLARGYEFIEFEPVRDRDRLVSGDPHGFSVVRVTAVPTSENCRRTGIPRLDQDQEKHSLCLRVEHVSESKARVRVIHYEKRIASERGTLTEHWTKYRDAKDGRLLARELWFKWESKNVIVMPDGYLGVYACTKPSRETLDKFLVPAR